jgi:hypothetical protein
LQHSCRRYYSSLEVGIISTLSHIILIHIIQIWGHCVSGVPFYITTMEIPEFIKQTNFHDLRDQKACLVSAIEHFDKNNLMPDVSDKLEGLLNFIDSFQDMCVDTYGIDKNEVFHLLKD